MIKKQTALGADIVRKKSGNALSDLRSRTAINTNMTSLSVYLVRVRSCVMILMKKILTFKADMLSVQNEHRKGCKQ